MDNKKKIQIVLAGAAGFVAMLLFLLGFSFYQAWSNEKALYESTDSALFAQLVSESDEKAAEISRKRIEEAENAEKQAIESGMAHRIEKYKDQLLLLVNPWNEVPEDYIALLDTVEDGYLIDRRCAQALTDMINDCRAAGNLPVICSAYRTHEYQEELYQNKIKRLVAAGTAPWNAPEIAARSVAIPGTSEHQLGLAVDIIDENYVNLDQYQQYTNVQKWLMANCSDYGFILRYPNGSSEITGIIFEPWHYRYVGVSTAKAVEASGLTFEEYLQTLE